MGEGRRPYWRLSISAALILIVLLLLAPIHPGHRRAAATTQPNIVLILTDDQRWDTLWSMPYVQSELIAHGINFTNGMVVNSLCCPARATILTGQYSHKTGIYGNSGQYGGFRHFRDSSTVATWLQGGGYHTGLVGKYLNLYNINYIPPGWNRWVSFIGAQNGGAYYDYTLNEDGTLVNFGHTDADYSTDVLAAQADSFIRTAPQEKPLFLYFSPFAPHQPTTPATKYKRAFQDLLPYRPPNYNEADVTDKPAWVRALQVMPPVKQAKIDNSRRNQYRTFLSVDDAVNTIITALTDTGRLSNTLIVFTSDNGWSLGEHRWNNKKAAWEESIRVPMVVRYDPLITTPGTDGHLVANLDLAPTFAAAAGVASPGAEGMDVLPLLTDPFAPWRHDLLIEHLHDQPQEEIPTYCAVRDDALQPEGYTYVVNNTGEEELYDLKTDFYQLTNVASDPAYASVLSSLRTTAETLCTPAPPTFVWPYDALPPTVPTSLTATAPLSTEVDLSWVGSTDNVGVAGYTIYRDGVLLTTVGSSSTTYMDTTVLPNTTYSYTVDAFDAASNHSPQSSPAAVTTPP